MVAARMEAQRVRIDGVGEATDSEIDRGEGAGDGLARPEQPARRLGRVAQRRVRGAPARLRIRGSRQAEEGSRLVQGFAERVATAVEPDEVEKIAVLTALRIGLMCS